MRCLCQDFKPNAIFHIYNHAIDDYQLCYDDEDYDYLINIIEDNFDKIPASIFAYCIMPDHYHFLIRQDSEIEIFKLFNYSFIRYAIYYNKKYSRKGPIFCSPLQHKLVTNDFYLLQLSKYIHMNPVRKDLVDTPGEWPYSNYLDWISEKKSNLFSKHIIEKLCPVPEKYIRFIDSYTNFLTKKDFWDLTFRKF